MSSYTTLSATAAKAACDAIVDLVDSGNILFTTAADATVCEIALSATAFGAATSASPSVATLADTPLTSDGATAGTVTKGKFRTSGDAERWTDTVGTASAGIILTSNVLGTGDKIELTTYTMTVS